MKTWTFPAEAKTVCLHWLLGPRLVLIHPSEAQFWKSSVRCQEYQAPCLWQEKRRLACCSWKPPLFYLLKLNGERISQLPEACVCSNRGFTSLATDMEHPQGAVQW